MRSLSLIYCISRRSDRNQFVRPPWRYAQRLNLNMLAPEDFRQVFSLYQDALESFCEADVPTTLRIRFPFMLRRSVIVQMDDTGIHHVAKETECLMQWKDVASVEIIREHHGDEDFREVNLKADDGRLLGLQVRENDGWLVPDWQGARPEVVEAFIRRQVNNDCFVEMSLAGAPESLLDIDTRLKRLNKDRKCLAWLALLFAAIVIALMIPELERLDDAVGIGILWVILRGGGLLILLIIGLALATSFAGAITREREHLENAREEMLAETVEQTAEQSG